MRADSVRSQCLVLVSSLIEIFGDEAIQALLLFIQSIFITQTIKSNEPRPIKEDSGDLSELQEFQKLLSEHVYTSSNPKHIHKRKEVGLHLLGIFAEDISMYLMRNPEFSFMLILLDVVKADFASIPTNLRQHLVGRTLWTCE